MTFGRFSALVGFLNCGVNDVGRYVDGRFRLSVVTGVFAKMFIPSGVCVLRVLFQSAGITFVSTLNLVRILHARNV